MVGQYRGAGCRKTSIAQVHMTQGSEEFTTNKKDIDGYLDLEALKMVAKALSGATDLEESLDVTAKVASDGFTGQAGAIYQGLSRALVKMDEEPRPAPEKAGFPTRNPRMKERKKHGLKGAREAPQLSKR